MLVLVVAALVWTSSACQGEGGRALDADAEVMVELDDQVSGETDVAPDPPETVRTTFRPSAGDVPNPDRGFYAFVDDLRALAPEDLAAEYDSGVRLVYTPIRLDAHREGDVPETELALMSAGMDRIREAGLGLIVRFAYNYPESEEDYLDAEDAPLDRVRAHILQLAPLVSAHADIVTFWQAGFIGAWGEWHSSSNALDLPGVKDQVRDALLEVLPDDVFLQVRYPPDLARLAPEPHPEADFAATPRARVGLHNDCFMSSDTDVGTFEGGLADPLRTHIAELARTVPFGGETCNADEETPQRTACSDVLTEGARYHVSYLNRDYHTAFHDQWRREGCYDEVERALGYRLELRSVSHPAEVSPGAPLTLTLTIENTGWARPFAPRRLVLELVSEGRTERLETTIDARRFTPGEHTRTEVLLAPLTAGRYAVALGLPH
ncbi:MAG TPA: DUF4832 domain-containing protein, partial [Myxococcota bacterium]|nr:DUF4832 domain-containing protein [Myxococcota bacterium]